jgi:hypothetical protein
MESALTCIKDGALVKCLIGHIRTRMFISYISIISCMVDQTFDSAAVLVFTDCFGIVSPHGSSKLMKEQTLGSHNISLDSLYLSLKICIRSVAINTLRWVDV